MIRSVTSASRSRRTWIARCAGVVLAAGTVANATEPLVLRARLAALPATSATAPTMLGNGSVAATFADGTLRIVGHFERLNSPATVARVHRAPPGLRGPGIHTLSITNATSGTLEGTMRLTAGQVEELKRGWLYIQIYTDKNPEGHLRGWLLSSHQRPSASVNAIGNVR